MKHWEICHFLFLWKEEIPTSKGFNIVRICLWTCVLFLKWVYYEIWNFENFLCINISYYQDHCHIEKNYIFFFFFIFTNWRSQRKAVPKNFPIISLRQINVTWPFLLFFFFLTSILTHFKTWQTKKTGEKNKMKVSKMASDEVSSEIMLQQEKSHWQVGIEVFTRASHICKKVKSIQNIICLVCDKLEAKNERGHQNTLFI